MVFVLTLTFLRDCLESLPRINEICFRYPESKNQLPEKHERLEEKLLSIFLYKPKMIHAFVEYIA